MNHLALLARLAGQEVDRERQALAALDAELEQQRQRIARERAEAAHERDLASGLEGARLLATWLAARRQRRLQAERTVERLEGARAAQLARLTEQRLELRRLELLQARQQERRQAAARHREQRAADEIAVLRAARRTAN